MRLFVAPIIVSIAALAFVWYAAGLEALFLAIVLALLEITLSFDNAVVNAKILEKMSSAWQQRFLTWGMLASVVGVRLILPILIVSAVALVSPLVIAYLAVLDPSAYSRLLLDAGDTIKAFGGTFLLLLSLQYFFDEQKTVHWLARIEKHLARWGSVQAIETLIAVFVLLVVSYLAQAPIVQTLTAALSGLVAFTIVDSFVHGLGLEAGRTTRAGFSLFVYLNVLDAAFSLDGVVGAFALSTSVLVIVVGLGIGAYFVRSLTIHIVRTKTLTELRYIEHGAYWAIFGLALAMLVGLIVDVPEVLTATIGLAFIGLSYLSSRRALARAL